MTNNNLDSSLALQIYNKWLENQEIEKQAFIIGT